MRTLVRDLNRAYRDMPALHARDCEPEGFEWLIVDDSDNSVFAWLRKAPGRKAGRRHQQLHAGSTRQAIALPLPQDGRWREIINTDAADLWRHGHGQSGRSRQREDGELALDDAAAAGDDHAGHSGLGILGGRHGTADETQPLARDAMAYVLAGRTRQPAARN